MHASHVRRSSILLLVSALPLFLAACSQQPVSPGGSRTVSFACGNQTVGVVGDDGTSPKDVYLCPGDTLTWLPNGNTFTVTFPKKYPFQGPKKTFTNDPQNPNNPVVSPPAINARSHSVIVYHYDMTVNGQPVPDPQVVGGGGN